MTNGCFLKLIDRQSAPERRNQFVRQKFHLTLYCSRQPEFIQIKGLNRLKIFNLQHVLTVELYQKFKN